MLTGVKAENVVSSERPSWLRRALRIEWLGQTAASLFWVASVFTYGISRAGDWLQLLAASSWLVANIAAIATPESAEKPKSAR